MKKLFLKNITFFAPYLLILFALVIYISIHDKIEIHIFINEYNNQFFDVFFKYLTFLGNGFFALIITVILLFINVKWSVISAISNILTSVTVQVSKLLIFADYHRPKYYFDYFYKGDHILHTVEGTFPGIHYSFPSGHTATAFAVFFLLAIIVKPGMMKICLLFLAILIAFSRIYLSWHFLQDTVAGSLYGVVITFFIFYYIDRNMNKKYNTSIISMKKGNK